MDWSRAQLVGVREGGSRPGAIYALDGVTHFVPDVAPTCSAVARSDHEHGVLGAVLETLTRVDATLSRVEDAFDPDEPRDEHGRWTGGSVTAYHGTGSNSVKSILKHGLRPYYMSAVFIGTDKKTALRFARQNVGVSESGQRSHPVVLELRVPKSALKSFRPDPYAHVYGVGRGLYRKGGIPADWIVGVKHYRDSASNDYETLWMGLASVDELEDAFDPDEPRDEHGQWTTGGATLTFAAGEHPPASNLQLSSWTPPEDWSAVTGTGMFPEPPLPDAEHVSTGAVVTEPDGRVWLVRPTDQYGGYRHTFPKGGLEPGLSARANAIKEVYEESGLKVRLTGHVGDYAGDTGVTRYYRAEREGGTPLDHGPESEAVVLAPQSALPGLLNRSRDRKVAWDEFGVTRRPGKFAAGEYSGTDAGKLAALATNNPLPQSSAVKFGDIADLVRAGVFDAKSRDETVRIRSLRSAQDYVLPQFVEEYQKPPSQRAMMSVTPIAVAEIGGERVILDGNHRVVAALRSGQKTVDVRNYGRWRRKGTSWHADADWDETKHPRVPKGSAGGGEFASSKSLPSISLDDLEKTGPQMGTNPGGVYQNKHGPESYYVKQAKSPEHARQEKIAAELAARAGVHTFEYRDVAGAHNANLIATRMVKLDKNNLEQLSDAERLAARRDLAVHAWLANWDTVGLTGDNVGVKDGRVLALDFGGSLDYRAQGAPKGAAFGTSVGEVDTLRDPHGVNKRAASLYEKTTNEEFGHGALRVASLDPQVIKTVVEKHGGSKALYDKLIARQADLKARADSLVGYGKQMPPSTTPSVTTISAAAIAAGFMKEPSVTWAQAEEQGQKMGSKPPPLSAAEKAYVGPDTINAAHVLPPGLKESHPDIHAALQAKTKGNTPERIAMRKLILTAPDKATRQALQSKILRSFQIHHSKAVAKGNAGKAAFLENRLAKYATKYGMPEYKIVAKTTAEANLGYSAATIAGAKEVMASASAPQLKYPGQGKSWAEKTQAEKEAYAKYGSGVSSEVVAPAHYSPEEVKSFNDLVAVGGVSDAKHWIKAVASRLASNPIPGLSAAEAAHIYAYTTSDTYGKTNKLLREHKGEIPESFSQYQAHANSLNAALSKLPNYEKTVWRKITAGDSVVSEYAAAAKSGKAVVVHQFSSAAKDSHHWHGNIRFEIQSRTGKDVVSLSANPGEAEVLFRAGTEFRVYSVEQQGEYKGKNRWLIKMEEVQ